MSRNGDVNQPTREFPEYPTDTASTEPAPAAAPAPTDPTPSSTVGTDEPAGGGRRGPARGLLLVLGAAALAVVVLLGTQVAGLWPSWRNPFAQEQTDRSQPPLLKSIRDLSRYVAAEGNFQVVVDLQTDRKYVPDFLLNQRTLFVGAGRVEAYVDFSKIADGAVVESADGKSVEITLPAPQLAETNLDLEKSYVFAEKRGLLNRLGDVFADDPNRQREVYRLAEERITAAARDSGLTARAEANTRKMLEGLLRSLGYQTVTVTYATP
ncbi:DUF4230 domain-containing protein [Micromonospora sagamiensis]|uniref:Uncharacterized protein DUF4230 n=1 Tax=Micromonospora sagamiensis TaxID=47875 RepID=A0A562WN64_9ACTN|nr:DUF4230 domain-containing protein [Micromonospora sagamiensis]TWJ31592.1 uncharacterized protein DUF4230 [Micromonospora sagamiensis]BCL15355.1 hypothetical protein GCM10017556_30940 [Micromonospora sagamiensis]